MQKRAEQAGSVVLGRIRVGPVMKVRHAGHRVVRRHPVLGRGGGRNIDSHQALDRPARRLTWRTQGCQRELPQKPYEHQA